MLIAQLSVASEDVDRPRLPETPTTETDQAALEEFACDRSNLPWVIFRAAHRANHATTLPARARALLGALARTVDASRPYAAIFARRELLTGRAMQSMRTFYRGLDDLEAAGLIVRPPQKRHGDAGLFGRAYLHLTDKATFVLGLVERQLTEDKASATELNGANSPAALSLGSPSATVADGAIYKDLDPKIQKRQSGTVPGDLTRLLNLGFHEFLIFKLMREAKTHSKMLSDVVEATWEHLRKAERPINYLRTLLRSPVDFGHQIRVKRATADSIRRQHLETIEIDRALTRCADQIFVDIAGQRRIEIGQGGASMTVHDWSESTPRLAAGNWKPAFVKALKAGGIRLATADDQETFAARQRERLAPSAHSGRLAPNVVPARVLTAEIDTRLAQLKQLLRTAGGGRSLSRTELSDTAAT